MAGKPWTETEVNRLKFIKRTFPSMTIGDITKLFKGRTYNAVQLKWKELKAALPPGIPESPYPVYDNPLVMRGDALVLPDPEIPFHHAEFLNRVIELALHWGITQCVIGGDAVHFNSLSGWAANWLKEQEAGGLSDQNENRLIDFAKKLSPKHQDELFTLIGDIGQVRQDGAPNVATELREARSTLKMIGELFTLVDFVLGNHEGRLIRTLNSPLFATDLLGFLGLDAEPQWRISPFYYSWVESGGERFRVTHPKNYAKYSAAQLADKFQCHILMCHSHKVSMIPSKSGEWMGWQIGCCVDERRLPYAAQRDNTADTHSLGAAIIRNGYVWVLTEDWTDWERLLAMG